MKSILLILIGAFSFQSFSEDKKNCLSAFTLKSDVGSIKVQTDKFLIAGAIFGGATGVLASGIGSPEVIVIHPNIGAVVGAGTGGTVGGAFAGGLAGSLAAGIKGLTESEKAGASAGWRAGMFTGLVAAIPLGVFGGVVGAVGGGATTGTIEGVTAGLVAGMLGGAVGTVAGGLGGGVFGGLAGSRVPNEEDQSALTVKYRKIKKNSPDETQTLKEEQH